MTETRTVRSHRRTKTITDIVSETWEELKPLLWVAFWVLAIGFVEAL